MNDADLLYDDLFALRNRYSNPGTTGDIVAELDDILTRANIRAESARLLPFVLRVRTDPEGLVLSHVAALIPHLVDAEPAGVTIIPIPPEASSA